MKRRRDEDDEGRRVFLAQMERQFPQSYDFVSSLVEKYDQVVAQNPDGPLEVEAIFGFVSGRWSNVVEEKAFEQALTLLEDEFQDGCESVVDWRAINDSFTDDGRRIRSDSANIAEDAEIVRKQLFGRVDASYVACEPQDDRSTENLRDYQVRVNMKTERAEPPSAALEHFVSKKLAWRKTFCWRSKSNPSASFLFDVSRFWVGSTEAGLQKNVKTKPSKCTLEVELRLDQPLQSFEEKWQVFQSLVSKVQDLMEFQRILLQREPGALRSFQVLPEDAVESQKRRKI